MKLKLYIVLSAIAIISFGSAYIIEASDYFKGILALPSACALFAILWQIIKDNIEFEREKILQVDEHRFLLSATSHMANYIFEKRVEFCVEYIHAMQTILKSLVPEGPTESAFSYANKLQDVREKHRAWVTKDIFEKIWPFEHALRKMASDEHLFNVTKDEKRREKLINRSSEIFCLLTGAEKAKEDEKNNYAIESIIEKLQEDLGIVQLNKLRQAVIDETLETINKKST